MRTTGLRKPVGEVAPDPGAVPPGSGAGPTGRGRVRPPAVGTPTAPRSAAAKTDRVLFTAGPTAPDARCRPWLSGSR